jgi:hypothetical protein
MSGSERSDQLARLWRRYQGRCHWCGRITQLLPRVPKRKWHPLDMATRDHLRSKLNERRWEPVREKREYRIVLACRECNQRRARHEELLVGMEKLKAASSSGGPTEGQT